MRTGKIILCKGINLDSDFANVLNYSENDMLTLCNSHKIAEAFNYSFIRETENTINTSFTYSQVLSANYIAFQNTDYDGKWFFAWIEESKYINDGTTRITFKVDSWSTWFSYWSEVPCYTLREHVSDDTIGLNQTDEGLAVQDVVCEDEDLISDLNNYYIAVTSNWDISLNPHAGGSPEGGEGSTAIQYNNVVFGHNIFLFDLSQTGVYNLGHFIWIATKQGHIEDVHDMFIVPKLLFGSNDLSTISTVYDEVTCGYKAVRYDTENFDSVKRIIKTISKQHSFEGFTPKNNKLYCYPYNYLVVTNNIGSNNIYKYEDFEGNDCLFDLELALSIGVSGRLVPNSYKGQTNNIDESLTLGKYPTCSWSADSYTNWLSQNAVNIGQEVFSIGANAVSGNVTGVIGQVGSMIGEFYKASLLPQITGGTTTGDVNFASNNNTFRFYKMHGKLEYLKQIDDYFSRFGYKILRVKKPNLTGRQNWNYIQIGQGEIIGKDNTSNKPVPDRFMNVINNIARNGVTIWHNHDNIGNYNLSNNII